MKVKTILSITLVALSPGFVGVNIYLGIRFHSLQASHKEMMLELGLTDQSQSGNYRTLGTLLELIPIGQ